jgi:hypothetical protein
MSDPLDEHRNKVLVKQINLLQALGAKATSYTKGKLRMP